MTKLILLIRPAFRGAKTQFKFKLDAFTKDSSELEKLTTFILSSYSGRVIGPGLIQGNAFLARRKVEGEYQFRIFNNRYLANFATLLRMLTKLFGETKQSVIERFVTNKGANTENYVRLGYFLEILDIGTFEIKEDDNPMVFIRLNDPYRIEKDSQNLNYKNSLLSKTLERYYLSNQIFDHFFLRTFSNEERWNFIEDYFLGSDVDTLIGTYKGGERNNLNIIEFLKKNTNPQNLTPRKLDASTSIHIFQPQAELFYKENDLLTLNNDYGLRTMKIIEWISKDPVLFDQTRRKLNLRINSGVFEILVSKLRAEHYVYFRDSLGLNMKIQLNGFDKPIKAIVPYANEPIKFYKWWCKNQEEVTLSLRDKIQLFNTVNRIDPNVLRPAHKNLLKG